MGVDGSWITEFPKANDTLESSFESRFRKWLSKENLHMCHENFRSFSSLERNFHD